MVVTLSCGPGAPDAQGGTSKTTGEMTDTLPTGSGDSGGTGTPTTGEPAPFDPCASDEAVLIGDFSFTDSLHILADAQGWQLAFYAQPTQKDAPAGAHFVRPEGDRVVLTEVEDQRMAVSRTPGQVLVCWDDGITSKDRDHGFCMTTDAALNPVTGINQTPYRIIQSIVEFPGVTYAMASRMWPIDPHGLALGDALDIGSTPLAFGEDWFLAARFAVPTCPNPDENALCDVEYAPFDPQGGQLAPFLPLADTTLAPNEVFRAAISGDHYLLAWTKGDTWEVRVLTRDNVVVRAESVDPAIRVGLVYGVPQGFILLVSVGDDLDNRTWALWPLDATGAALSAPIPLPEIDADASLMDFEVGASGDGLALAWVTNSDLLAGDSDSVFFRSLGCSWPPGL